MNNKTIAKWFSMFILLMLAGISTANAQKIIADDVMFNAGETKTLTIALDPEGASVYGLQADIVLPEGFSIVGSPKAVTGTMETAEGDEANASVSFNAKNNRILVYSLQGASFKAAVDGSESLTKDMFQEWDNFDATANVVGPGAGDYVIGESTGLPYGNGSVLGNTYADLSEYVTLELTVTDGAPRLLLNRPAMGDSGAADYLEIKSEDSPYATVEGNVWTIDIAKIVAEYGYAHLNAIKGANWANTTITSMKLRKADTPKTEYPIVTLDVKAADDFTLDQVITISGIKVVTSKAGAEMSLADVAVNALTTAFVDGKYYIQNVESGLFWGAGNDWGTKASLVKNPDYVTLYKNGDGTYTLESQVSNGEGSQFFNGSWMDQTVKTKLTFNLVEEGIYTISGEGSADAADDGYYGSDGTNILAKRLAADAKEALWKVISAADMEATLAEATPANPVNVTFLWRDANFGRNNVNVDSWVVADGCTNKALTGGNSNKAGAESYHSVFDISQTVTAPKGVYAVTSNAFYRQDGEDNENLPYFYVNDSTAAFPLKTTAENSMADAWTSFNEQGNYPVGPIFYQLAADGDLTIGSKLETNTNIWAIWGGYTVIYYGDVTLDDVFFYDLIQQVNALVDEALDLIDNDIVSDESKNTLKDAVKDSRNIAANEEAYKAAIATLTEAIAAAKADINADVDVQKAAKIAEVDALEPVGAGLFKYAPEAIEATKAAIEAATTVDELEAVPMPALTAPVEGKSYMVGNVNAGLNLAVTSDGVKLQSDAEVFFTAVEGGYAISNEDGEYIAKKDGDTWTFTVTTDIASAYVVVGVPAEEGYYLEGANGVFGTDDVAEGSSVWANKKTTDTNKNVVWTIDSYKAGEDVTSLAPTTWDGQTGTYAGLSSVASERYSGAGSIAEGDVLTQTITGLTNGKYQVTLDLAASYTSGRGFECPTGDDLVVAFANDAEENLPVVDRGWVSEGEQTTVTLTATVEDGVLKYGIKNLADAGNWYVARLQSIIFMGTGEVVVGIETVTEASVAAPANKKVFENGKIVIIKNGKKFNVAGVEIK